jgi:hypothetical protein
MINEKKLQLAVGDLQSGQGPALGWNECFLSKQSPAGVGGPGVLVYVEKEEIR